jgi:hypothetical protein
MNFSELGVLAIQNRMLVCNWEEFAVQARICGIMTFELESGQASKSADVAANMAGCFASCTFCWKRLQARNMGYQLAFQKNIRKACPCMIEVHQLFST